MSLSTDKMLETYRELLQAALPAAVRQEDARERKLHLLCMMAATIASGDHESTEATDNAFWIYDRVNALL